MVVTAPTGALRQIALQHAVDNFDRIADNRIIRRANSIANEVQKITTDHIAGGMQAATVGDLQHGCIRVGMGIGCSRVRRVDPHVVARKTIHEFTSRRDHPLFQMGCQPIGVSQDKFGGPSTVTMIDEVRGADQPGYDGRKR